MMKRAWGAVASLVLVAGCAQPVWVKPGADSQDFARDSYACERDVRQSGYYGSGLAGALNAQSFGARCMEAAGWHREVQQDYPAPVQSKSDYDQRSAAFEACFRAGLTPSTPGYYDCFQRHMATP